MCDAEPHRESSPDPLDFLSTIQKGDVLIAESLAEIVNQGTFLSLEDAFEYALASKLQNSKSSEPSQWKDIKECPDAHLWYAAALEEFNALLENGTFESIKLPPIIRRLSAVNEFFGAMHTRSTQCKCVSARRIEHSVHCLYRF